MNFRNLVVPSAGGGIGAQTLQTQSRFNLTIGGNSTSAGAGYALVSSGVMTLAGGNNITLSQNGNAVTISGAAAGGAQTAISGISVSDTMYTSGTVRYTGSNMVTVKSGTGQLVVIDATQTVQTQNMIAAIVSGANGNGTFSSGTLSIKAGNNITLSTGANVLSIHGEAAQTVQTQNMVAVIASAANGNGTFSSGTLSLKVGADITLSTGAGVVSIYGNSTQSVQTQMTGLTAGLSNLGNTSGNTGLVSRQIVFAGGNNITLSGSTNGQSMTITISGPAAGGAQTGISSIVGSDTTYTSGMVVFTGSNMVTVKSSGAGQTLIIDATQSVQTQNFVAVIASGANGNGTYTSGTLSLKVGADITLSTGANVVSIYGNSTQSVQTQMTGLSHWMSNVGNTTGTSGSVSLQIVLAGGNNIVLSQSTNGQSATITVSYSNPVISRFMNVERLQGASGTGASTLYVAPLHMNLPVFPADISVKTMLLGISGAVVNTSAHTVTHMFGIFTEANSTALSLLYYATSTFAQAAAANQSTGWNGIRYWTYNSSQFSNSASNATTPFFAFGSVYHMAQLWQSSSEAKAFSMVGASVWVPPAVLSGTIGVNVAAGATSSQLRPFLGVYSTNAMPTVISRTSINATAAGAGFLPLVIFENNVSAF